ncbi:unnamed protein product [Peronospora effusa]|nr:unnamed protein product [Peronospora effusa]
MASKVIVAIVLILVTLLIRRMRLLAGRADTLRSTESLTTTNEGNAEERGVMPEFLAKLGWGKTDADHFSSLEKISDTEQLIPKESEKVKISEKESKNTLSDTQVLKMSQADSPATKDNKVKKLVENESNKDITSIITTLIKEHYWQWYNEKRPAEEIHNLLGLPTGPALLKSPYVWFWLDYTIWVGRENMVETLNLLRRMFGGDDELAIMFWQLKQQTNLSSIPANVTKLKIEFLEQIRVTFTKEEIIELLRSVLAKLKKLNRLQPFKDPKNLNLLKYLDRDEVESGGRR